MIVKTRYPATIPNRADLDEWNERTRQLVRNLETERPRFRAAFLAGATSYPPGEESFAANLKRAVQARRATNSKGSVRVTASKGAFPFRATTRKEHEEYVERERARYHPLQRRPHSLGE